MRRILCAIFVFETLLDHPQNAALGRALAR
jgi:hypothetical protein